MEIPYPTFQKYINGVSECSANNLVKIAKYYNVSTDYLLGLAQEPTTDKDVNFICEYTGLNLNSVDFLKKLNSYNIGDCIHYPVENGKQSIGMVTCKYDTPTYIVNMLFCNPKIIGLINSYLCMLNDDNSTIYQGDKGTAILFELMLQLRKLRDEFQPLYEKEFKKYFDNGGVK